MSFLTTAVEQLQSNKQQHLDVDTSGLVETSSMVQHEAGAGASHQHNQCAMAVLCLAS